MGLLLDDIGAYLAAQGHGTLGADIFLGTLPPSPKNCIVVYEYQGRDPLRVSGGVAAERPNMQVVVRNADYSTARTKAEAIYKLLDGVGDTKLPDGSGTRYVFIGALAPPFLLARDQDGSFRVACNYGVQKEIAA